VTDSSSLLNLIAALKPGDEARLTVARKTAVAGPARYRSVCARCRTLETLEPELN
jgi:hypothetical protein